MNNSYWDEKYWVRHMASDDLDHIEDPWIEKYEDVFMPYKGCLLDLGCGVGQYSNYFSGKGFDVTAVDISPRAIDYLATKHPTIHAECLDMTKPLPFKDGSFDVVFANLSIHFFSRSVTEDIIREVRRVLREGGLFIGSCNSSVAYKYIKDCSTAVEDNFYLEDGGRYVRLFDAGQFEYFFKDWENVFLCEIETTRFNKSKCMWEFVYKKTAK